MGGEHIGRYHVVSRLGRGGMATVFLAHDERFARDVAVKVLPRELLERAELRHRFEREARTIASLEHWAIVPVYDFGEEDGQPYLVMRHMAGGALSERLRAGPLSEPEAAEILQRIGAALDEAHRAGVVHRDLKPGNVLFDARGDAYLSDFGIVKLSEATVTLTEGNAIIGTPAYMSPEQARGERDVDHRSDVYALGAMLYEMLSGCTPYQSDTPLGMALKHVTDPIPKLRDVRPDLPQAIEDVIVRAMAKERDARFGSAGAFVAAATRVLAAIGAARQTTTLVPQSALTATAIPSAAPSAGPRPAPPPPPTPPPSALPRIERAPTPEPAAAPREEARTLASTRPSLLWTAACGALVGAGFSALSYQVVTESGFTPSRVPLVVAQYAIHGVAGAFLGRFVAGRYGAPVGRSVLFAVTATAVLLVVVTLGGHAGSVFGPLFDMGLPIDRDMLVALGVAYLAASRRVAHAGVPERTLGRTRGVAVGALVGIGAVVLRMIASRGGWAPAAIEDPWEWLGPETLWIAAGALAGDWSAELAPTSRAKVVLGRLVAAITLPVLGGACWLRFWHAMEQEQVTALVAGAVGLLAFLLAGFVRRTRDA